MTLTGAVDLLPGEADVEGVGGVSSAGDPNTQLRRGHAGQLTRRLAEVRVLCCTRLTCSTHSKHEELTHRPSSV